MATIQELRARLETLNERSGEANNIKREIAKLEAQGLTEEPPGATGSVEKSFAAAADDGNSLVNYTELSKSSKSLEGVGLSKLGRGLGTRQGKQEPPVNLRYPDAEIYEDTDYLQIKIKAYKTVREVGGDTIVGEPGSRRNNTEKSLGTILLPVPPSVQDRNAVNYQGSNMNAITAAAVTGVTDIMKGGKNLFNTPVDAVTKIGEEISGAIKNTFSAAGGGATITDLITKSLASQAVGIFGGNVTVDQLLARNDGVIFNPNMELLFNGPSLRQFGFTFKMTPRSGKEGEQIKQIIRTFKLNMAPKVTKEGSGNLFLKTPNIFELSFMQGRSKHKFLNKFKQCFLSNVSVNYTGEGTHATYGDGTPISLVMTLQFQEIEPIYDIDYLDTDEGKSGVGY